MNTFFKRTIVLALSLLMVLGAAPAFAASAADAAEVTLPSVTTGDTILRAAFTNDTMKINGLTTEYGWSMRTKVGKNATAGAQWDHENLYLAVRTDNKEQVTLTVNGVELNKDNAESKISSNKSKNYWSSYCGAVEMNLTSIHEDVGLIPGFSQWLGDPSVP